MLFAGGILGSIAATLLVAAHPDMHIATASAIGVIGALVGCALGSLMERR